MTAIPSDVISEPSYDPTVRMIPITIRENGELLASHCACTAACATGAPQDTPSMPVAAAAVVTSKPKNSYYEILKSSALIGGAQMANIAIGIVRTKAMA